MRPVLAITHLRDSEVGLLEGALASRSIPIRRCNLFDDDHLPPLHEISAIVSFGGQMSVLELDDFPFLVSELALLREALHERVPTLGLCLGAQLLAHALGGHVRRLSDPFIGWVDLVKLPAATDDPLFHHLPERCVVLEWHLDAIAAPLSAISVAETPGPGSSIFHLAPAAWGSQMHLEVTPRMLEAWLRDPVEQRALQRAGIGLENFSHEGRERLSGQMKIMQVVFERFADLVVTRTSGSRPASDSAAAAR